MTVSSKKIINKMIDELQRAKAVDGDLSRMKIHLEKVQVLSELLLDEAVPASITQKLQQQVTEKPQVEMNPMKEVSTNSNIVEDEGDSIFDF